MSFADFWSLDEQRNPIVAAIAIKVSCEEVVSYNEISTTFVNEDDDVNLVLGVNILAKTRVDKSNISTFKVKSGVGSGYFVKSKPSELIDSILVSFMECFE